MTDGSILACIWKAKLVPMAESTVESTVPVFVDPAGETRIRVLHVDDEPAFPEAAKEFLEKQHYFEVDVAASVDKAVEKMRKKDYDVIVSDYGMPVKDGLEFLRELRNEGNNIPFVILTDESKQEAIVEALNLGADQFIKKTGDLKTVHAQLIHGIRQAVGRKRAEERLRESEEKYRNLFELAPDGILTVDLDGVVTSFNKAASRALGHSKDEILGKHFSELVFLQPADVPKFLELFGATIRGEEPRPFEVAWQRKDGTPFFAEVHMSLMKEGGRVTGVQIIARDITERTRANEKFERLFMNNPEAAVYLDPQFHILAVNPLFTELFGYSADEVKGKRLNDLIVPQDKLEEARMLDNNSKIGYVYYDTTRKRKDGSSVLVSMSAAPIVVEDKLIGIVELYRDISQRKSAERRLKKAKEGLEAMNEKLRVVGELTRHDVRNKLSAITANLFLAKKRLGIEDEVQQYLGEIASAINQIESIFDYAKTYERLGAEELTYLKVEGSIEEAIQLFTEPKGARLEIDLNGLTVLADSLLRQLFYNLIDNSLKHGERVSRIKVFFKQTDRDELKLIYEDNGVGIPRAEKERIFKEGYGKGTGYGLHLIGKMCEVYGWTIQETGEEGKGAQFTVTLPRINEDGKERYRVMRGFDG